MDRPITHALTTGPVLIAIVLTCAGCGPDSLSAARLVVPVAVSFDDGDESYRFIGGLGASWAVAVDSPEGGGVTAAEVTGGFNDGAHGFLMGRLYYENTTNRVSFPVGMLLAQIHAPDVILWDFMASFGVSLRHVTGGWKRFRFELSALIGAQGVYGALPQWSVTWTF